MEQSKNIGHERKGKHLTKDERVVIERMSRRGYPLRDIAETLGRHVRTIQREILRGGVDHLGAELRVKRVYSSDRAQDVHDENATAKGPQLKLGSNQKLVAYVYLRIIEFKESPDVVAHRMREANMQDAVCTRTLYSYIDQGLIEGVTNESLWEKRQRSQRTTRSIRRARKAPTRRQSIEQRPEYIDSRNEFGHWEIDLVVGPTGSKAALLTLLERKTRKLIIRKLKNKTHGAVKGALNGIEREHGAVMFRDMFKSITADNGSEFLDVDGMQNSVFGKTPRTTLYYAHPYASWERGSNENANRIIRRFVAKGKNIKAFTRGNIKDIERWINNYPRRIIDYKYPQQLFDKEVGLIAA
ncbi:MAG: IS30 family transposase [Alphaproteobacteria bacterium]|jgi:transposase, IS30 family